jgi:hypothetical protein
MISVFNIFRYKNRDGDHAIIMYFLIMRRNEIALKKDASLYSQMNFDIHTHFRTQHKVMLRRGTEPKIREHTDKSESKSKLCYDRRSVGQSVLVSSTISEPRTTFLLVRQLRFS